MKSILVVGAGHIGVTIAALLQASGDYAVTLADRSLEALAGARAPGVKTRVFDVADPAALGGAMHGLYAVVSAAPFHLTVPIAEAARLAGVHYLDLTEDVASTRRVKDLAAGATSAFIPQCGLAPGFISIVAADLATRFETLDELRLRVGALPRYPSNSLGYSLTWSTDGVINEYCEPCEAIVDGELRQTQALEGLEALSIEGVAYEAFNTSGGLGTLCETFAGQVRNLNYRTIRYPGHAAIMKTLLDDLRLRERRHLLKDILEGALPTTLQDVVIIFVTATGMRNGVLAQETFAHRVHSGQAAGRAASAIQITTASAVCAVLDLLAEGELPASGFIRQEDIALTDFLANRFGRAYATPDTDLSPRRHAPLEQAA
jgi:saccharopine dehydrogenase-like NADP-dependent oxidoreductase